jgi:hypothetical protein
MRRIGLGVVLAVSLIPAPLAADAQQPGKVYRVGILTSKASDPAEARLWQVFRSESSWLGGWWSHIPAQELEAGA